jgi:cysteine-rich repeat protein
MTIKLALFSLLSLGFFACRLGPPPCDPTAPPRCVEDLQVSCDPVAGVEFQIDCAPSFCDAAHGVCASCGDGFVSTPEECDDGNLTAGDGCNEACLLDSCGDGIVNNPPLEECDDADLTEGDECDSNCTLPACGNGILDPGELCDDGNLLVGDGCEPSCTLAVCGDGILDPDEECDDGNLFNFDGCESNCTTPRCGNNNQIFPEECDDGNILDGDGCQSDCTTLCGDGFVFGEEECDNGAQNSDTLPDGCRTDCRFAHCGDNILDSSEECDDGCLQPLPGFPPVLGQCDGFDNGDGCDFNCVLARCGNGVVDGELGETCDDGCLAGIPGVCELIDMPGNDPQNPFGDGCDSNCTPPGCRNGILDGGEQCDDGNGLDGDGCSAFCTLEICGDGILNGPEDCDDGNQINGDGCDNNCVPTSCNDGVSSAGELCLGSATSFAVGAGAFPEVGDLNGDGLDDVVVMNSFVLQLQILLNQGAGQLAAPLFLPFPDPATAKPLIGDINGDNHKDVMLVTFGNHVELFINDGTGQLNVQTALLTAGFPMNAALAELTGDSLPELIVGDASSQIEIFTNQGAGQFSAPLLVPIPNAAYIDTIAAGDINADGLTDLILSNTEVFQVAVLYNLGSLQFSAPQLLAIDNFPMSLSLGDLNGDNLPDLVMGLTQGFDIFLNQAGSFGTPSLLSTPDFVFGRLLDIDLNGTLDLLTDFSPSGGEVRFGLGGAQFSGPIAIGSGSFARVIPGRFDASPRPDLLLVPGGENLLIRLQQ